MFSKQRNAMQILAVASAVALVLILAAGLPIRAQSPPPATQPQSLSADSSIDAVLDALDARGKNLQDFSADVKLTNTDNATGDDTASAGTVLFQHKPDGDSRIRVSFVKKIVGNKARPEDHQYVMDGGWLVERDYLARRETRRQLLRPGQKVDLIKLGEGPFPLPIGQSKEDVKKLFDVEKAAPAKDDPAGTVHLKLTPKPGTSYARQFKTIDLWIDQKGSMPTRIETQDGNLTTTKRTDLSNVKTNTGLGDADFKQDELPDAGWQKVTEPFRQD